MKLLITFGAIATFIFTLALIIAGWQTIVSLAPMTLYALYAIGFSCLAGCTGFLFYWFYSAIELKRSQSLAVRYEASKIHSDNSAVILKPGQIVQLQAGPLGYGTISNLHTYSPRIEQVSAAPVALPVQVNEVPTLELPTPLTALEAVEQLLPNQLNWNFGIDETGESIIRSIADSVHVLNVGGSGSGKTTLTANLLYQLVTANEPELYQLFIADMKNTIGSYFEPFATRTARFASEYASLMSEAALLTKIRFENKVFNDPLLLVVVDEALAIQYQMTKEEKAAFNSDLVTVATLGREYNVFLLSSMQVSYARNNDMAVIRGQYATRLAGYVEPKQAQTMGFMDLELIKRAWSDRKPGQFLLETSGIGRIIQTPKLNLKNGELTRLLAAAPGQVNKSRPGQPAAQKEYVEPGRAAQGSQNASQEVITAQYRELPAAPVELEKALKAYQAGAKTVRSMQAALGVSTTKAGSLLSDLRRIYGVA